MTKLLMISILNLSLVIPTTALSNDKKEYCFTKQEVDGMYRDIKERDILKDTNESLERTIKLKDLQLDGKNKQIAIYEEQNEILTKTIRSSTSLNTWERVAYIGLGVIATSLAVYGAGQLGK